MTKKSRKSRKGYCVECGHFGTVTRDHIPPKGLFSSPLPSNLITVPTCTDCHAAWSKDDEWFRLMLALRASASENADANAVIPKILRSLERQQARGMNKSFFDGLRPIELTTPSGIYLGETGAYNVDLRRLFRVVERIVRGLIWNDYKSNVKASEFEYVTHSEETLSQQSDEYRQHAIDKVIQPLLNSPEVVVGERTFSYRCQSTADKNFFACHMRFYDSTGFLTVAINRQEAKQFA